ncbi:MAG: restriction endonuclease, partial [Oceanobacter sp.]
LHMLLSNKSLLRDAVVTPEQVTPSPEGFSSGNFDEDKVIGADDIRNLSWQQFEAFVAELFAVEWQVKGCMLTATQDHGADVVLDQGDQITLIQCKHTASAGSYRGYKAVKEVESAERMYKKEFSKPINRLIVVTNATRLSADTGSIAKDYGVEVIDGRTLGPLADKHQIPLGKVTSRLQSKRLNV